MPDLPVALDAAWLSAEVRRRPNLTTIVSLVGEPTTVPPKLPWPTLVCFAPAAEKRIVEQIGIGAVRGAVVQRHDEPPAGTTDWFSLRYTVLSAENAGNW